MSITIEEIAKQVHDCKKCPLHEGRTNPVPGEGPDDARIMFIGEAPGEGEDKQGRPFVGASGKLLENMLATALTNRSQVYLSNTLRCRPPGNTNPTPEQIQACNEHLDNEIEALNPQLIVTLGGYSTEKFFPGVKTAEVRSRAIEKDGRIILPMFHPAAALRRWDWREQLIKDFEKVSDFLEGRLEPEKRDETPAKKQPGQPKSLLI